MANQKPNAIPNINQNSKKLMDSRLENSQDNILSVEDRLLIKGNEYKKNLI